jgi:Fe-S oxidoreductase
LEDLNKDKIQKGLEVLRGGMEGKFFTHLNSCVHCGLWAESCIYYLADSQAKFIPAVKVDLISSIYRRYHALTGKLAPALVGARNLDQETIEEMVDLFYGACTICGRCVPHCSIGVDISYLVSKGREMLSSMGYVPKGLQATIDIALNTGNHMGISDQEFTDTLKWLEKDLQLEVNDKLATIPLNETGKDILYTLNPREPKFFPLSISAMAIVFQTAKESWTLSTKMYDISNYAYYSINPKEAGIITQRLYDEVLKLGAKICVLSECGHGSRAFRWEGPNYIGKEYPFEVITSVELLSNYIREGRIKLNPEKIQAVVTLHDPCNLARTGGIWKEQRHILKNAVKNFVEMAPEGIDNLCCGGGGGQLAMSEYYDRRMKIGELKAEQIRKTGAKVVVTPCHNCIDQLRQLNVAFKLNVEIKTMAEIVADALILK